MRRSFWIVWGALAVITSSLKRVRLREIKQTHQR